MAPRVETDSVPKLSSTEQQDGTGAVAVVSSTLGVRVSRQAKGDASCRKSWAQPSASEVRAVLNIHHSMCTKRRGAKLGEEVAMRLMECFRRPLAAE